MNNKEYGVKLKVDISDFTKKIDKAKEITEKAKKKIEEPIIWAGQESSDFTGHKKVKITQGDSKELDKRLVGYGERNDNALEDAVKEYQDTIKEMYQERFKETPKTNIEEYEKEKEEIKEIVQETGKVSENIDNHSKKIRELHNQIDDLVEEWKLLTSKKTGDLISDEDKGNVEGLENEINNLLDDLEDLTGREYYIKGIADAEDQMDDLEDKAYGLKDIFKNMGDDISNSFDKGIRSIKRFTLSLFGIHSVWTALSRAVRSYMAYDTEANTRIQANWVALGAMFAPIVEKIVKWIQKLVAYINVFYKALTGKNFITTALDKVKAKSNGASKAVKGLNKELANFDEITNLNFDKGSDSEDFGIADALGELENIELDPKMVKDIEDIAKVVKELYENWIKPIVDALGQMDLSLSDILYIGGTLWATLKLTSIYNDVAKIIGVSGGTTGFLGLLTVFGMIIDFQLAYKLGQELANLVDVLDEQKSAEERLGASQILIMNTTKSRIEEINKLLEDQNLTEEQRKKLEEEKGDKIEAYKKAYEDFNMDVAEGKKRSAEQKKEVEALGKELDKITKTNYTADVNLKVKAKAQDSISQKIINFMFGGLYGYLNDWNLFGIKVGGNGFAKGNVAYEPTYGEFGEYAGARSNPEITTPQNIMKETMLEALQEANLSGNSKQGDTILYVNGKELARATYNDFKSEGNRLGSSNIAIRRV